MTQRELAEKLSVSFQTVTKWERGICFPDISVIPVLAELFRSEEKRTALGERAFELITGNRGATDKSIAELEKISCSSKE